MVHNEAEVNCEKNSVFYLKQSFIRWKDDRLRYSTVLYANTLEGEAWFADKIWTPNVYIENEVSK